jgi:DSF synthase
MKRNDTLSILDSNTENYEVRYEADHQLVWSYFKYPARPCISTELIDDVAKGYKTIAGYAQRGYQAGDDNRLLYHVADSRLPNVFSMGGDLNYFMSLIRAGDREGLYQYGKSCIDVLYPFSVGYDLPFTTIGLVRGEALGGGFEIALASKVLIAEKSARFGFPETVFGLFPGMGAFSFLARKLTPSLAKRMIASGKVYTADELYEMGVIDQVVEDGCGEEAVYEYIKNQRERMVGMHGFDRVVDEYNPISYEELIRVVEIWADTALQLSERNLRVMAYLVRAQNKRWLNKDSECHSYEREIVRKA